MVQRRGNLADVLVPDVGQRLRKARRERGMTLAQAGGADLSRSSLSAVEAGRRGISIPTLAGVARSLEQPLTAFLKDGPEARERAADTLLEEARLELERDRPAACLRLLESVPTGTRTVRAAWVRGSALRDAGRAQEAVEVLERELASAEVDPDVHFVARYQYALGNAFYTAGAYDRAITQFHQGFEKAMQEPPDRLLAGKMRICLGHICYAQLDFDAAIAHYEQARELFGPVRDYHTMGSIYSGLNLAYRRRGNLETAIRYGKLGVAMYRSGRNLWEAAVELNNLAMCYLEAGDLKEALEAGDAAVTSARQAEAWDIESAAHATLALIHLGRDDLEAARLEAEEAERTAPGDRSLGRIAGWKVLAEIAERQGDHQQADALYKRALSHLRETAQVGAYGDTSLAYSLLLRGRGDLDRAWEFALQAARP